MRYTTFRNTALGVVVAIGAAAAGAGYLLTRGSSTAATPSTPSKPSTPSTTTTDAPVRLVETTPPANAPTTTTPTTNAPPTTADANAAPSNLRDVDNAVLTLVQTAPVQAKLKDATKGKPYKIDLASDDGKAWNRAKVDLDRDGKWDEKWTLKGAVWHREVSPGDDESYTDSYVLAQAGWKKK